MCCLLELMLRRCQVDDLQRMRGGHLLDRQRIEEFRLLYRDQNRQRLTVTGKCDAFPAISHLIHEFRQDRPCLGYRNLFHPGPLFCTGRTFRSIFDMYIMYLMHNIKSKGGVDAAYVDAS